MSKDVYELDIKSTADLLSTFGTWFAQQTNVAQQNADSSDLFLSQHVVNLVSNVRFRHQNLDNHTSSVLRFTNIRISRPYWWGEEGKEEEQPLTPEIARMKNLTYGSYVCARLQEDVYKPRYDSPTGLGFTPAPVGSASTSHLSTAGIGVGEAKYGTLLSTTEITPDQFLLTVPVILGSFACNTQRAWFVHKEYSVQLDGTYSVGGLHKVLSPIKKTAYNWAFTQELYNKTQRCFLLEIRCSPFFRRFCATSTLKIAYWLKTADNGTQPPVPAQPGAKQPWKAIQHSSRVTPKPAQLLMEIPFNAVKIPVLAVYLALGCAFVDILPAMQRVSKGFWYPEFDVQIQDLLDDCPCKTQDDALIYISQCLYLHQQKKTNKLGYVNSEVSHAATELNGIASLPVAATTPAEPFSREKQIEYGKRVLRDEVLPRLLELEFTDEHQEAHDQVDKRHALSLLVWQLLMQSSGRMPLDDRDHLAYVRFDTNGPLLAGLVRQQLGKYMKQIQCLMPKFKQTASKKKETRLIFLPKLFKQNKMTSAILLSIRTGKFVKRSGVTQPLDQMNPASIMSHLTRLWSTMNVNVAASSARSVHKSHAYFIDAAEVPEGKQCGLVMHSAFGAFVGKGSSPSLLISVLQQHLLEEDRTSTRVNATDKRLLIPLREWNAMAIDTLRGWTDDFQQCASIVVEGVCLGFTAAPERFVQLFHNLRSSFSIDVYSSIYWNRTLRAIEIFCGDGRIMRPLWNVKRMHAVGLACLQQWTPHEWFVEGALEYVDASEERMLCKAFSFANLQSRALAGEQCTHMEIDASFWMGASPNQINFANFNQGPRITYQSSMYKAAVPRHLDPTFMFKGKQTLFHTQKRLITTLVTRSMPETYNTHTINAVVGIEPWDGWNQEDSVTVRSGFINQGGFVTLYEVPYRDSQQKRLSNREIYEKPTVANCVVMKRKSYAGLQANGLPLIGTMIYDGDPVIGKTCLLNLSQHKKRLTDVPAEATRNRSCVSIFHSGDPAMVIQVIAGVSSQGLEFRKVVLQAVRIATVGDKIAIDQGNKGVISKIVEDEDMPFNPMTGMRPDCLMHPLALPGRMTNGVPKTGQAAKAIALSDKPLGLDATPFRDNCVTQVQDALHAAGFVKHGEEVLYNGKTGRRLACMIFMGIMPYQRMKQQVCDKLHVRSTGQRVVVTRQPAEGKARDGGIRFGEMEKDCCISYGARAIVDEQLTVKSDACLIPVGSRCGIIAIGSKRPVCRYCKPEDKCIIYYVRSTMACKIFIQEMFCMGIDVRLKLKPTGETITYNEVHEEQV